MGLNGSILRGRALMADGRNAGARIAVKPGIVLKSTERPSASQATDHWGTTGAGPAQQQGGYLEGNIAATTAEGFITSGLANINFLSGPHNPYDDGTGAASSAMAMAAGYPGAFNGQAPPSVSHPGGMYQEYSSSGGGGSNIAYTTAAPYQVTLGNYAVVGEQQQQQDYMYHNGDIGTSQCYTATPQTPLALDQQCFVQQPSTIEEYTTTVTTSSTDHRVAAAAGEEEEEGAAICINKVPRNQLSEDKIRNMIKRHVSDVVAAQIVEVRVSDLHGGSHRDHHNTSKKHHHQMGFAYVWFRSRDDAVLTVERLHQKPSGKHTLEVYLSPATTLTAAGVGAESTGGGGGGGGGTASSWSDYYHQQQQAGSVGGKDSSSSHNSRAAKNGSFSSSSTARSDGTGVVIAHGSYYPSPLSTSSGTAAAAAGGGGGPVTSRSWSSTSSGNNYNNNNSSISTKSGKSKKDSTADVVIAHGSFASSGGKGNNSGSKSSSSSKKA